MGNRLARLLLSNIDIPPPCRSSMQRTANCVSTKITQLNQSDMADKVREIKQINKDVGLTNPESISVAVKTHVIIH